MPFKKGYIPLRAINMYYEIHRTKLYGKEIDIRSYERQDALSRNQDLLVILDDDNGNQIGRMILTTDQLKDESLILNRQRVASKVYQGQWYELLSYRFKKTPLTPKERKAKKDAEKWEKYNSLNAEQKAKYF